MVPSSFGLPTLWHCAHPLVVDDGPSSCVSGWAARLIAFRKLHLFRFQTLLSEHRRPRRRRMAAPQEFLVDRLVTAPAVAGGQLRRDDESVMVVLRLTGSGLVAIEAVDALLGVPAQFVLVDDRILLLAVTLGALAGRPHEGGGRLIDFHARSGTVDEKGADDQGKRDHDRDEDRPECHAGILPNAGRFLAPGFLPKTRQSVENARPRPAPARRWRRIDLVHHMRLPCARR
jgi:hypothetical protein